MRTKSSPPIVCSVLLDHSRPPLDPGPPVRPEQLSCEPRRPRALVHPFPISHHLVLCHDVHEFNGYL